MPGGRRSKPRPPHKVEPRDVRECRGRSDLPRAQLWGRQALDLGRARGPEHDQQPLREARGGGRTALVLLRHQIDGSQLEGSNGGRGSGPNMGAHHHNGPGRFRHDVADGAETIQLRHLDVHQHDIRCVGPHLPQRIHPVARRGYNPELTRPVHHFREQTAEEGAVVYHEHPARVRDAGYHEPPY